MRIIGRFSKIVADGARKPGSCLQTGANPTMVGSTCLGACSARCGPRMSWERLHERVATARKLGCSEECPFASLPGVSKALRRFGLGNAQGREMLKTVMYYWNAARGYRWKPWKSPYMRWRFETFLGEEAAELTARKFFRLAWKYREYMERFVDWASERRRIQHRHHA